MRIGPLGLTGDVIADTENHGGLDQAVYVYGVDAYAWWSERLGWPLEPGTFAENLTVSGFLDADIRIGDRLQVGACLLEVTAPRIPCGTLAARMHDPQFVKAFRRARLPGAFARVVQDGEVRAGDPVEYRPAPSEAPGLIEVFDLWFEKHESPELLRRLLVAPVAERDREEYARLLRDSTGHGPRRASP